MYEKTLRLRESRLGPDHPDTFISRTNLALAYERAGRWAEAEPSGATIWPAVARSRSPTISS